MMRRPIRRGGRGFTLLEIMLAVGIGVVFMGGAAVFLSSTGGIGIWSRLENFWRRERGRLVRRL